MYYNYNNIGSTPYNSFPQYQNIYQPSNANTNKIFVNGEEEVRNRVLPPNSDYIFLDNDKPIIYQKVVNGNGQFTVKIFDITPREDVEENKKEYITKEEYEALLARVSKLEGKKNESAK